MTNVRPIAPAERILALDTIRGIALLGIFIMNVPGFNTSFFAETDGTHLWPQWWDRTAEVLRDVLFSGKFNSMFSMLFAVGFTIQLERLLRRDPDRGTWIYVRRVSWLFIFGLAHACIFWTGDVLHMYALLGFLLLVIRKLSDRAITAIIVACLLYAPIVGTIRLHSVTPASLELMLMHAQAWEASGNAAFGQGTFVQAMVENARTMIAYYTDPEFIRGTVSFYVQIFTTVLIGLLLGRHAFFQNTQAHLAKVRQAQWCALAFGIATGVAFGLWESLVANAAQPTVWRVIAGTCYTLCRVSLTVFYVATIVRAIHNERWRAKLAPFALAGRMPLTNYLSQTLIATFVFFGWGLALWGKVGPALSFLFALVIFFAIQMPFSRWWLARFEQGPMEYLWRWLTYGRAQPKRSSMSNA